ncbi:helix-turn-helix domain-containing protein [Vibrio jasicida]|uniref:helix-turn-helix domain-containing protein n=1 Tax=Vibrio jasicida TaxID=766224 RepID=UPI00039A7E93|nr:helix-turn-helix transcriptional regulator [Vibrio jasicida]
MSELNYSNMVLDRFKSMHNLTSEYQLAKKLGVSESQLRHWRKGRSQMDWDMAFYMADKLSIEGHFVLAALLPHKIKNARLNKELKRALDIPEDLTHHI